MLRKNNYYALQQDRRNDKNLGSEDKPKYRSGKGQLNSEWISEVNVSPKMPIKNLKDFCPTL